jgi:flagellar protein FliO/FliZ
MSPALFMNLKRLLCAGLCCIALYAYADPASDAPVAATESPIQSNVTSPTTPSATTSIATTPVATSPAAINATPIGGGRHLVSVVMALFGIIVLIFAISWFVKRFGQGGFTQNQHIKIIATMPLGTRERIVLIEAGGQQLLLGITAAAINTLHVFNEPVVLPEREPGASDFSRKLMTILQQKSSGATGGKNNNSDDSATR